MGYPSAPDTPRFGVSGAVSLAEDLSPYFSFTSIAEVV